MKIVLDTNILVRAFVSPHGTANQVLTAILANRHTLILSNEIIQEVAAVLRRPRLMTLHAKAESDIHDFAGWLKHVDPIVSPDILTFAPIRDAKDTPVLRTALSGPADVICTLDRDFFEPPASEFLRSVGIAVLTDVQLLRRLRQ